MEATVTRSGYARRLEVLRAVKRAETRRKQELLGAMDYDDQGQVMPPPGTFELIEVTSGSGITVRQPVLKAFRPLSNHPSGGFFGARATGENFRRLLAVHPTYIQPESSLCGVYMVSFMSSRQPEWNPDFDYSHLHEAQARYGIDHGIGLVQHFCPDLTIGLRLGWGGLADKIRRYRLVHPAAGEFYDGLAAVVDGVQGWIERHADDARRLADGQEDPELAENLSVMADQCARLVSEPPRSFREACQWLVFFQAAAKMYNGSGEWGQLDEWLRPYYEEDRAAGRLTDEEAVFHLACLLLTETAYIQLGGPDANGRDLASPLSFLILEAVHRLRIPANVAIRVGAGLNRELFRRGIEILLEDKMGFPKFLGDGPVNEGFMRNGYPIELARQRIYAGCHWTAVPGREYGMCDLIKIELATVFDLALKEMLADGSGERGTAELWRRFSDHLRRAVAVTAEGIDFHLRHMQAVFPELLLDLFCHGPLERGLDATGGGLEFYNIGVDGASLATVADSFAALEQRVEQEGELSWDELQRWLESDWAGVEGECARLRMKNIRRFGSGGSAADDWAVRISRAFTELVTERRTPDGYRMIPSLFSWAKVIGFGRRLGATPDGRRAGEPLSHGPNPTPGFNEGRPGTPTQMISAVAAVQPGRGNPAPLQLDLDPGLVWESEAVELVEALLLTYFDLGGTLVNVNVLDKGMLEEACEDPSRYPDLIVRVTGFSAYYGSLSPELRRYVRDRVV